MGAGELIGDFIGYLAISAILFFLFFGGAIVFGKNVPAEQLLIAAGLFGLIFYGLFRGVVLNKS
ncbi:hypothetical protein COX85_01870 [Candidatus Micrarchaeota archaeon CG_4_10_14_0_2_um_filter_55_9]|nr:MAG: hypothetical protein AUJ15_03985 [Candidatus Micrarchaeota archaeon CG1_02_55_41]PIO02768.1 MAG: hypothetical protein COT57_02415 [Candidatus Micrarchaeota archaeon CG09_land_8_20_14_0_10_55_25]PIZ91825.1 MAG: hypothetical protein COX85_01870 [Candidatus Micrarchaeota archaeon CG_4_10_14_0_2_um_filter_55_9]PJD00920.1 MAG: hypothetical protein COU38_03870 [Candidatus Micrarchaeota archaeon CG10_big_fil_rev_8_21_14_0_10_54_18]